MTNNRDIADISQLTANQHQFVLRSLKNQEPDPGQVQIMVTLRGLLQPVLFNQAWQQVIQAHRALRSSFHWQGLVKPLQVVHKQCRLQVTYEDLTKYDDGEQGQLVLQYQQQDKSHCLVMDKVPNQRLHIFHLSEEQHLLCWTCHHLQLDGWSAALVANEVLTRYQQIINGQNTSPPPSANNNPYINWLDTRPLVNAKMFWRTHLEGLKQKNSWWRCQGSSSEQDQHSILLSKQTSLELSRLAKDNAATLSHVLQAAWACSLARLKQQQDVWFGVSLSGRSAPVPGIEKMVGLFVNILPIRVSLTQQLSFSQLLKQLAHDNLAIREFEYVSLTQLQNWGCMPPSQLFDSLLLVENYRVFAADYKALKIAGFSSTVTSNYPLTLIAIPGEKLKLSLLFNNQLMGKQQAVELLATLSQLLQQAATYPNQPLSTLETYVAIPELCHILEVQQTPNPIEKSQTLAGMQKYIAPRNTIELHLQKMWEDLLGISPIGLEDNFFDLGGHSLLCVRLFKEIEKVFNKKLPLDFLWVSQGTIKDIANLLAQCTDQQSWPELIEVKKGEDKRPLFCVHTMGGHLFHYYDLAHHLSRDQPVYGLQARGIYGEEKPNSSIEEMACVCIQVMREHQPEGPYRLLGFSSGGIIAYEMARQLTAKDIAVEPLILLDTYLDDFNPKGRWLRRLQGLIRAKRFRQFQEQFYHFVLTSLGLGHKRTFNKAGEAHRWAYWSYCLGAYTGEVTLFLAQQKNSCDPAPGWRQLVKGRLNTYQSAGSHSSMIKPPHVQNLALVLQDLLDQRE